MWQPGVKQRSLRAAQASHLSDHHSHIQARSEFQVYSKQNPLHILHNFIKHHTIRTNIIILSNNYVRFFFFPKSYLQALVFLLFSTKYIPLFSFYIKGKALDNCQEDRTKFEASLGCTVNTKPTRNRGSTASLPAQSSYFKSDNHYFGKKV